ncbi:MAG: hypothetical protein QN720_13205, partial [Nitrososphaeraceae archaeon]|nr:hypothetical protein [Nitrososphaeraceae archaeon]MDW0333909.1 hypothetical protein [Nitrososphaeraceae archaeon]
MTIRLKVLRQREQRIKKIKNMMDMYSINVSPNQSYNYYQPVGGSSLNSNYSTVTNDPQIEATKNLFQMFHV